MRGGDVLAYVVSADGQLAVAAVDHDGKLDRLGTTEVDESVERRPDCAARVEDVVHEDDVTTVDVEGDVGPKLDGGDLAADVVAVEAHVEGANGRAGALDLGDLVGEQGRERGAAANDADQGDALGSLVLLDDLMRDARERTSHGLFVHDLCFELGLLHGTPFLRKRRPAIRRERQEGRVGSAPEGT